MSLSQIEYDKYLKEVIIPGFTLVNEDISSVILDRDCRLVICTNKTARAMGVNSWQELVGTSFGDYENRELQQIVFKRILSDDIDGEQIKKYCKKIYQIQQEAIASRQMVSLIDMLPYAGNITTFLLNYVPIIHPNSEVIGLQCFAIECRFFSFHEHIKQDVASESKIYSTQHDLSKREAEILFLLAHNVTQDQISQVLEISRSTVATNIERLCGKFGISGSNTKILSQVAINSGFHHHMPQSLWKPSVIVLKK